MYFLSFTIFFNLFDVKCNKQGLTSLGNKGLEYVNNDFRLTLQHFHYPQSLCLFSKKEYIISIIYWNYNIMKLNNKNKQRWGTTFW